LAKEVREGVFVPIKVPKAPIQIGGGRNNSEDVMIFIDGKILTPNIEYIVRDNMVYVKKTLPVGTKVEVIVP